MTMHDVWLCVQAVVVALAWWRVWRLEDRVRLGEVASAKLDNVYLPQRELTGGGDYLPACIPSAKQVGEARAEIRSLARALGYEWKRTEAKEGWERNFGHVAWPNIPIGPQYRVGTVFAATPKQMPGKTRKVKKPTAYEDMRVSQSWGCVSPFSSASRACSEKVDADVMALLKRRKTDHEPTADRRKGERRKPTASSLAAADMTRESEVAKAVKRAKKKPRRGKS